MSDEKHSAETPPYPSTSVAKEENDTTVSVVVVAYNSAKTILETLDSIYAQTYSPLELIIADDASTDDTATIAREWIDAHRSRFVRAEIIVAEKNGGIPANCNRGVARAQGVFMKSIAADDILLPNCIEDNVAFMQKHPEAQIVFSKIRKFSGEKNHTVFFEENPTPNIIKFFEVSAQEQLYRLAIGDFWVPAPGNFARTELFRKYPYDERIPAMDDFPKWCQLTRSGIQLHFMDVVTVLYRINPQSVQARDSKTFYSVRFMESQKLFFLLELRHILKNFGENNRIRKYERNFLLFDFVRVALKNKKNLFSSFCKHAFSRFLKIAIR